MSMVQTRDVTSDQQLSHVVMIVVLGHLSVTVC